MTISSRIYRATKSAYQCISCLRTIPIGERYEAKFGMSDADDAPYQIKLCKTCSKQIPIFELGVSFKAATEQSRSENSQSAERKASDDASTNQKDAGVHQTEEKP